MERATRAFSSDLAQLAEIRAFVRGVCARAWGAPPGDEALCELDLAVSEAASNIIRHAYRGQTGQPIELVVDAGADSARISMYHRGQDFDPTKAAPPVFDGTREGGFGLYLITQSVDEVVYARDGSGRCETRLVKNRK
jgi:anti-sigma regulatory factor (Ser/Thr protein kinase)